MPKKPERPISAMVFPKSGSPWLKLDGLPTDKNKLELEIAQRFVAVLNKSTDKNIRCLNNAIEPGDVLLQEGNGADIFLQIGEAVDIHRAKTTAIRKKYGSLLWSNDKLHTIYKGVQVAMLDTGEARDLPSPFSKKGKVFLNELVGQLFALECIVNSLPNNKKGELKGKETFIDIDSIPMQLNIRLLRYAQPSFNNPSKWLWTGSHRIEPNDNLENFTEVIKNKSNHYANISNPFWLLVYSVDSISEKGVEHAISNMLMQQNHPFDRVYLFFPRGEDGELRKLFPNSRDSHTTSRPNSKKILCRMMPQDAIPKWNDPRWEVASKNESEECKT